MKNLKKIVSAIKKIRLSEDERMNVRTKLIQFMEDNPMAKKPDFWSRFSLLTRRPLWATATAAVLLVVFTGTATYASESALPGDFLYPFKVDVVEELQGAFMNDEEKADWQIDRMRLRFEEAELLSLKGGLNPTLQTELSNELIDYSEEIRIHIKQLEGKDKKQAVADLRFQFKNVVDNFKDKTKGLHDQYEKAWKEKDSDGILFESDLRFETTQEVENETSDQSSDVETELEVEIDLENEDSDEDEDEDEDESEDDDEEIKVESETTVEEVKIEIPELSEQATL